MTADRAMKRATLISVVAFAARAFAQQSGAAAPVASLMDVKRIYVAPLAGSAEAESLRALIIANIDGAHLFVLTDNESRADAILKGAADDHSFTDTFDSEEGINDRVNGGKSSSGSALSTRTGGAYGGFSVGENDSHHTRERKHEAYAALRLCNRDGDVLWSTTQESNGGKFRGASAGVAFKVAHQLAADVERARQPASTSQTQSAR